MTNYDEPSLDSYSFVCAFRFPKTNLSTRAHEITGFQFHHDDPIRRHVLRGETFILGPQSSCYNGLWEHVHGGDRGEWEVGWRVTFTMPDNSRCSIWKAYEIGVCREWEKKLVVTRRVERDWEWVDGPTMWPDNVGFLRGGDGESEFGNGA